MAPTYTLYHGRFIQLPRQQPETKPSLDINTGVLWVLNADGRIQGFDWSVPFNDSVNADAEVDGDHDDTALSAFVQRQGWTIVENGDDAGNNDDGSGEKETVVVVKGGRKGRNAFFFPGFIGLFPLFPCFCFFLGLLNVSDK